MKRIVIAILVAGGVMLHRTAASATPTAQQLCDFARVSALRTFSSCTQNVLAKNAKGAYFDQYGAFARCRHTYFRKWVGFQGKASLSGTSCIGNRFTDNGDGTITDNLNNLVWEQKSVSPGVHYLGNDYTWSSGPPYIEDGTVFVDFLATLNSAGGFAGASGWRLPTLVELETLVLDFPCRGLGLELGCRCPVSPCIDSTIGPTVASLYLCNTTYRPMPQIAWNVDFDDGGYYLVNKTDVLLVRAVRGGL